ncbi:rRNA pseudouridine synthase [Pseudenhygromyxa sp. WMMC2535]|uniref:pseudouridine synthase n=1 Tax=Pseudenhygromyxa sp. WMMC2535 TaxID=2712867 RepID=UPI0015950C25|nr:pseudouridine synthase [Pseudenhygromyxa sp. WMMC2535]NVB42167.1 rRNA pseudouridine synthase [Pseudenhygromyxa sp. WMMC2535]
MAGPRKPSSGGGRSGGGRGKSAHSGASGRRKAGQQRQAPSDDAPRGAGRPKSKRGPKRDRGTMPFAPNEREEREGVRLQKFMAGAGVASRRKAEELIVEGAVSVNGRTVTELGTRIFPGRDRVTVHGRPITPEDKVYYLLNKPDAVVCAAAGSVDERGRPTVLSLMHGVSERLYPVGRLDYRSRGLVLLTNDGELAQALTHPRHGVVKTYHVKFQGKLDKDQEEALRQGVVLDDGARTAPVTELFAFRETDVNVWYQIGIREGLNRQIRRMGEAIDRPVLKLIRVAIGDLTLDGIEEGEFRALTATEVGQLLAASKLGPEGRSGKSGGSRGGPHNSNQ